MPAPIEGWGIPYSYETEDLVVNDYDMRVLALELAVRIGNTPDGVVHSAEKFYGFLLKSVESSDKDVL